MKAVGVSLVWVAARGNCGLFLVAEIDIGLADLVMSMVLVDTSVWINHFRKGDRRLENLLDGMEVVCHPFIIGELACGHIKNRQEILSLLQALPVLPEVGLDEHLYFVEEQKLFGRGIGFVDIQLLASAQLEGVRLWTSDKKLKAVAEAHGLLWEF